MFERIGAIVFAALAMGSALTFTAWSFFNVTGSAFNPCVVSLYVVVVPDTGIDFFYFFFLLSFCCPKSGSYPCASTSHQAETFHPVLHCAPSRRDRSLWGFGWHFTWSPHYRLSPW